MNSTSLARLDIPSLPQETVYTGANGSVNMLEVVNSFRHVIDELARGGHVKATNSLGFAMAKPAYAPIDTHNWNKPDELAWFVGGWGPNRDRYIANALRKMRALARTCRSSTLAMKHVSPGLFENEVDSAEEDGSFAWGDFAYGGALRLRLNRLEIMGGVSGMTQMQDDFVTYMILATMAQHILEVDGHIESS
jgi:hypothetical protein